MNESGYSFVETILSVVIVMLICTTFVPVTYNMKTNLYNKKLEVVAAETAYEGLKQYRYLQQLEGMKTIEGVNYHWTYDGQEICVAFHNTRELRHKCIQLTGENK
ncbi:hypothetical protein [Lysinibacillus parviboronicapiens]|uniref:Type II secretory pathway pseudopilin PulG n=1 Tax=Lysinibacillus parviboronicapiens TaxID=436516 RepID=A0ABV2PHW5_9BACI|nr:hypothetical protein [Lysinibacillus parviboronicapiens]